MTITSKQKTIVAITLAAVLLLGVGFSAVTSFLTHQALAEMMTATGLSSGETHEDDISILEGQYWIRSTTQISDAYHSGSETGLSDKDKETLAMATEILDELITEDMTPYEKEKAVYDWMSTELTYDTGVLQVIPQTEADCDNPYGVLKYHNAVCVGYATTFRLFMQMLDIPCMVVHNTDRYHSWNLVQLDGDWYHVDIYSDQNSGNYANFNMNDDMATVGHSWDQDFFPAATGLTYNYAVQSKEPIDDIYDIPARLYQALTEEADSVALDFAAIDEPHAQIVEAMLSNIQSLTDTGEFGDLWMEWRWVHLKGSEYVLAVYFTHYDEDDSSQELSEEDLAKVEEAIQAAFGQVAPMDDTGGNDEMTWTEEAEAVG